MSTDRALLEQAAKAAGLEQCWTEHQGRDVCLWTRSAEDEGKRCFYVRWNPLEDDGDALRLAVHLGILLRKDFLRLLGSLMGAGVPHSEATRQAIVQVAASIGSLHAPIPTGSGETQ